MNEYVHSNERRKFASSYMRVHICNYVYICAHTVCACVYVDAFVCVYAYFHVYYTSACLYVHAHISGCLIVSKCYTTVPSLAQ
jgi:hypothetical protein